MKKFLSTFCVVAMLLTVGAVAYAVQSTQVRSGADFNFWIENFGSSSYSQTPATKTDSVSALINCNENTVFWPYSGVVLRVRNENHQYATYTGNFSNGEMKCLSYLNGQNYTGTKWLYGSISDSQSGPYDFAVSGHWVP